MKQSLKEIAPRLRTIRNILRISQREFAQRLGISMSHYSKLEAGIGGISEALLMAISTEARADIRWLSYGKGDPPVQSPSSSENQLDEMELSLDQIEELIRLATDLRLCHLAEKVATTTKNTPEHVLAVLLREKLAATDPGK